MTYANPRVAAIGQARLTYGMHGSARMDLRRHRALHGRAPNLALDELVRVVENVRLHGRGGAAFPFARKIAAVVEATRANDVAPVVLVNGTEGEPAAAKDKLLLSRVPHLVLDGAAIAAGALGAREIVVGVAGGTTGESALLAAVAERQARGPIRVVGLPERFITGEGGALVRGVNGQVPIPPGQKVLSAHSGVDGLPTLLSNAETYAQLALAVRLGADRYCEVGTPEEPGTVLLSVSASGMAPTVVETPTGVPLRQVLDMCRISVGQGVLMGGYHGGWLTPDAARAAVVSRAGITEAGASLGAGIVVPLPAGTCPLGEVARVAHYLAGELAGQCGPCRFGLPEIARVLDTVLRGIGGPEALETVRRASGVVRGRGACSHPDGTVRFLLSALAVFDEDVAAHVGSGGCGRPVRGVLPLPVEASAEHRLAVDWTRCDAHGLCATLAPELISMDANGYPVFTDAPVPDYLRRGARRAVRGCPALALRLSRRPAGR